MPNLTISIKLDTLDKLIQYGKKRQKPISQIVSLAVSDYLERAEDEAGELKEKKEKEGN